VGRTAVDDEVDRDGVVHPNRDLKGPTVLLHRNHDRIRPGHNWHRIGHLGSRLLLRLFRRGGGRCRFLPLRLLLLLPYRLLPLTPPLPLLLVLLVLLVILLLLIVMLLLLLLVILLLLLLLYGVANNAAHDAADDSGGKAVAGVRGYGAARTDDQSRRTCEDLQ